MKECSACKQFLPESEFGIKNKKTGLLQWSCKACIRESSKRSYANNKDRYIKRAIKNNQASAERFAEYKATLKCICCGEDEPACLDFHHLDPAEKDFEISSVRMRYSMDRILAEVAKCVVLCSNCHRKVHADKLSLIGTIV